MEKEKRKVRSDKLIYIKPTIPLELKECISRIAYLTDQTVKDLGENICREGLSSKLVIEILSQNFKRDYWYHSTLLIGDLGRHSLQRVSLGSDSDRITLKVPYELNERIKALAYSLDVTPSKATALLMYLTLKNTNFINEYIKKYKTSNLNYHFVKELKEILAFINQNNSYNEVYAWSAFLSYLYGEMRGSKVFVSEEIYHWIKAYE
ncbi:hypothetical protein [Bacillus sp. AFS077874]|uniref:hypothetical protein n=1 Tax=Bacillus sp. AFS077874 TaxID=2033513 RepID=UPI0025707A31|nr:hypothetical protein [Bacillus sp. AFS077874]